MEKMTFAGAMLKFIGRLPDETPGQFAVQLKRLTQEDRQFFIDRFRVEKQVEIVAAV